MSNRKPPIEPGDRFDRLVVTEHAGYRTIPSGRRRKLWLCTCDCGTQKAVLASELNNGHTRSCGCLRREKISALKSKDVIGRRFGRLIVVGKAGTQIVGDGQKRTLWACACDCGEEVEVLGTRLRSGHTKSCGCISAETLLARNTTQGGLAKKHSLYSTWEGMIARCYSPGTDAYPYYGGRGIEVCDRWRGAGGFLNFLADMGDKPPTPEAWKSNRHYWTIDRVDNDGDYEPGNCRWADPRTQARNR